MKKSSWFFSLLQVDTWLYLSLKNMYILFFVFVSERILKESNCNDESIHDYE